MAGSLTGLTRRTYKRRGRCWRSYRKSSLKNKDMRDEVLFDVSTPLGFHVRCTKAWWGYVSTVKHPVLENRLADVIATLSAPVEVRRSTRDNAVLLFYRVATPRFLCVVTRKEDEEGFLITAYPTDSLKTGEIVWSASE
jgi:hypothetical protein